MIRKQILGFDFGGTKVDIGLAEAGGELLASLRLHVGDFSTPEELVGKAIAAGKRLSGGDEVTAIGVSTMGITYSDHVELAPNICGWSTLQLPQIFSHSFPSVPVQIENDVRAACYAEWLWGSLRGKSSAAYLNLGTGIGMAFIIDGKMWRGHHGAAGEVAYLWTPNQAGFREGHAPFEEQYGGGGLDRRVREQFEQTQQFSDLFILPPTSQQRKFLSEVFGEIARRIGHVLLALDVEVVSVGGGIANQFERFAPIFHTEWERYLPYPPDLVLSQFRHQTGLQGALALAAIGGGER